MHSEFEDYYGQAVESVRAFVGLCHEVGGPELAKQAMVARAGLSDARRAFYGGQSGQARIPKTALESAENYSAWLSSGKPTDGQYEILEGGQVLDTQEGLIHNQPEEFDIVLQFGSEAQLPFHLADDEDLIVCSGSQVPYLNGEDYLLRRNSPQRIIHLGGESTITPGQKLKVKKIKKREASTDVSE